MQAFQLQGLWLYTTTQPGTLLAGEACNVNRRAETHTCVYKMPWAGKAEHAPSPSPVVRCRGCAPRSCRLHTFSGTLISAAENEERALRHQVTPSRLLPQGRKRNPYMCPGTAALCVHWEFAVLASEHSPHSSCHPQAALSRGAQGSVLFPPSLGRATAVRPAEVHLQASRPAPPAGGSMPPRAHSPAS